MDTFQILARSTSIKKSSPATSGTSNHQIPSAGLKTQPQNDHPLNTDTLRAHGRAVSRGAKRKRSEVEKEEELGVIGKSNNFCSRGQDINWFALSAEARSQICDESQDKSEGVTSTIDKEECRRTLKLHNIKVTILQDFGKSWNKTGEARSPASGRGSKDTYTQILPQPLTTFETLRRKYHVSKRLMENLSVQGYRKPTEVQIGSLPLLLGSTEDLGLTRQTMNSIGKPSTPEVDLLTIAPTGSGKTLCFMIHVLYGLLRDRQATENGATECIHEHQVQALIIAPTHELADQIANEGKKLALGTGIKVASLRKGTRLQSKLVDEPEKVNERFREATNGKDEKEDSPRVSSVVKADILISTPLTLLHAISEDDPALHHLPNIRFLVLDEADVLLDPLFREQTLSIWKACTHKCLRITLWSATMGSSIESLTQSFILDRRRKLDLRSNDHYVIRLVVGLKDTAISNISHRLIYAASEQGKLLALRHLLHPSASSLKDMSSLQPPFLIFTQNVPRAKALHSELLYDIPIKGGGSARIAVLHSEISDTARSKIMAAFRKGEIWILITTDLFSRGVDFRGINGIVNYDIPNTGAAYVHRAGRTGRQGREGGVAITLYTKEDIPYVKSVANVIAASEEANRKSTGTGSKDNAVQPWLLSSLPDVSKKAKKVLKNKGVESRRATVGSENGKEARKMRISTKSGYDRRLENRRRGAVVGSQKRDSTVIPGRTSMDVEEWGGIDAD